MVTTRRIADGSSLLVHVINLTGWDGTDIRDPEPMRDVEWRVEPGRTEV